MRRTRFLQALTRSDRGATLIEFAMILPVLSVMLLGMFDIGYRAYVASIVQGALHEAARMATVGSVPMSTIENHVSRRLREFSHDAEIEIETDSYSDFTGVAVAEPLVEDADNDGQYDQATDCYRDINGSGKFSRDMGRDGMGGAEDVVRFQVTMTYPRLFPMASLMGWSDDVTITQNTVLRNQPYAGRTVFEAPKLCRTAID